MARALLVCLAGAIGTGARWWASGAALRVFGPGFPYGTLIVNVVGSFVLAAIMHLGLRTQLIGPDARLVLGTGFCGGFTTYSTFNYETMKAIQDGAWATAAANVVVTVVVCLAAGVVGWTAAGWIAGGRT
jgi:CrcB protein